MDLGDGQEQFCAHEWRAPRVDVVISTVPVNHVCALDKNHPGMHICICGAAIHREE